MTWIEFKLLYANPLVAIVPPVKEQLALIQGVIVMMHPRIYLPDPCTNKAYALLEQLIIAAKINEN